MVTTRRPLRKLLKRLASAAIHAALAVTLARLAATLALAVILVHRLLLLSNQRHTKFSASFERHRKQILLDRTISFFCIFARV